MTAVTLHEVSLKDLGERVAFFSPSEVLPWQGRRKMFGNAVTGGHAYLARGKLGVEKPAGSWFGEGYVPFSPKWNPLRKV